MGRSDADGTASESRLPDAVVEDLLDEPGRRAALRALAERDGPVHVEDLAVAARAGERGLDPADVDPADVADGDRRALADEFRRRYLPTLTATAAVEYDSRLDAVALGEDPALLNALEGS